MIALSLVVLALALFPALLYWRNIRLFLPPPAVSDTGVSLTAMSVLIPARNEEGSISLCVSSVLTSTGVELEVIVLDDHSTDRTAELVQLIAAKDSRMRVESAPPLPAGWCGKQFACFTLAKLARHPILAFLDADVRLSRDALARLVAFQKASGAALVSGFPRQETGTLLEKLVIPLINWLLLCYLPMGPMRRLKLPGLGAGCGQWFLTTREAYETVGGHAAVKASLHDGVKLPREYRQAGFLTDVCDATDLAVCRMYRSASQVWNGLAKNAREGLGAPGLIWVWTVLLFGGHVMPVVMLAVGLGLWSTGEMRRYDFPNEAAAARQLGLWVIALNAVACIVSVTPRLHAAVRFRAPWVGPIFHAVSVVVLLGIQWYATVRHWLGRPVGWKGRPHPGHTSSSSAAA